LLKSAGLGALGALDEAACVFGAGACVALGAISHSLL
jgi:hypothetical protein